ncbi:Fpg/Nei family DNA glycosylase [Nocardioides euryhalodurans]|uniref:DNA-(apurinic or apyrimidinic site) lyase n=1 Tax=Nocardioides euryhalodurans TaxID=2518370 RepID=A0A4P7GI13_9ACTN|nr:DNA-formamidopyrimidine glycosylase family protein [Nocardioides euryhalodurans]QBR91443.1 Fpg/Nei family DNA glycosylase [Nocardioides euryhalodurans]
MPEGDTVFRAARLLDRTLAGHELRSSDFRVPQLATTDLTGGRVLGTWSRGKHLLTRIDASRPWTLHTHLKMEGSWQSYFPGQRWRRPPHTARVVLTTADRIAVGFSLGIVELLPREHEHEVVGHLGPDLLGPDWDEAEAVRRLQTDPDRPLSEALLDQTMLAGIGNMYMAELCFVAGLHPTTPVGEVADLTRLVRRAQQMLDLNKDRSQQTTTGDLRQGRRMWVYRRDQQPCLRCGTTVEVAMRGEPGQERASYWCPSCQPRR